MYSNNLQVYNTQNTDTTGSHRNRSSYTDSSCVCTACAASSACTCVRWRYSAVIAVCTCSVIFLCMGEMEGSGWGLTGEGDAASSACACMRWICGVVSASPACVCMRRRLLWRHLPVHMCDGRLVGIACLCVNAHPVGAHTAWSACVHMQWRAWPRLPVCACVALPACVR
jgi:hypothetical protein